MNCYTCGRYFRPKEPHLRRRVKTGEKYRKQYKSSKVELIYASYGMRIVCKNCAKYIDRMQIRNELLAHAGSVALLAGLVLLGMLYALGCG
jgi:hypothetical protein